MSPTAATSKAGAEVTEKKQFQDKDTQRVPQEQKQFEERKKKVFPGGIQNSTEIHAHLLLLQTPQEETIRKSNFKTAITAKTPSSLLLHLLIQVEKRSYCKEVSLLRYTHITYCYSIIIIIVFIIYPSSLSPPLCPYTQVFPHPFEKK